MPVQYEERTKVLEEGRYPTEWAMRPGDQNPTHTRRCAEREYPTEWTMYSSPEEDTQPSEQRARV